MHVVIIGGGIGGLTLAHGLRRRGVEVSVHERDPRPDARWEGYRIHIDPHGTQAFRTCLPYAHRSALWATAGPEPSLDLVTEKLVDLVSVPSDTLWPPRTGGEHSHLAVDRAVLRRILFAGLDDVVHLGAEFIAYQTEPDGRTTAVFADGRRVTGDVLVGADGAGSRVARQLVPDAARIDTGAIGIGHRLPLTEATRAWLPEVLTRGVTVVTTPGAATLFVAAFDPPPRVAETLTEFGVADPPAVAPYLLAALVADPAAFPPGVATFDDAALAGAVDRFVTGWHPDLQRLLVESDPAGRTVQVFRASEPAPAPWPPGPVTVLGDAIHQMPPVGGMGGNTARRDGAHRRRTRVPAPVRTPPRTAAARLRPSRDTRTRRRRGPGRGTRPAPACLIPPRPPAVTDRTRNHRRSEIGDDASAGPRAAPARRRARCRRS